MKLEFHHINYVSKDVGELDDFYRNILQMESLSPQNFPRTDATNVPAMQGRSDLSLREQCRCTLPNRI